MMNLEAIYKYLFIPGLILGTAGLVSGLISGVWSPLSIGLSITGLVILILWIALTKNFRWEFWQRRSTQAGTNAITATLAVLAFLVLINFLAIRHPYRVDLTENQLFSLSPQTEKILQNLEQPVKVWLFAQGTQTNPSEREILENYKRKNSLFSYEIIDPDRQPGLVQEFKKISSGNLSRIYLQYGNKKQPIPSLDEETLSEVKLTNAIETIRSNRIQTVYILQGHGEHPLQAKEGSLAKAVDNLEGKGYRVVPLNLAEKAAIPQQADVIILAGAERKLFPQEVAALKEYSERGGSLLLLLDPDTDLGLDPLLKTWGIQLDRRVIIDGSDAGNLLNLGPATPLITRYGSHPITQDFGSSISIYPFARPIGTLETSGVEAVSLLVTDDRMWAESDLDSPEITFDRTKDLPGPFDLGVALTRKISPTKTAKLVVIGNSIFATDGWFEQQLNGDVFLNSVGWLSSREQPTLSIRAKDPQNRRINLNPLQANLIFWLSIVILPLLSFLFAGITWWRRR